MKYFVFVVAAAGVPPLAFLLFLNRWWMKYVVWAVAVAMCFYNSTAINFFSCEDYRGSSRGMEVSAIYLLSLAVLGAIALRKRLKGPAPEAGFWLYIAYFALCLPSFATAADGLFAWFEIWKMAMLYLFLYMVFMYLSLTDDLKTVVNSLAAFAVFNMLVVVRDHFSGTYQPHGVFPHQNSMAMAMQLMGPLFFAHYLRHGLRGLSGKLCAAAFVCAAGATARSYSRMALALMPVAYGVAALASFTRREWRTWFRRMVPVALAGAVGLGAMLPRIVERFATAPKASADTRVQLALCAVEMIKDEPWRGVGANNWGIKINPPYDYAERAERETNRKDEDFRDGIVETVYLLVGAECGLPALAAMVAWMLWYLFSSFRLAGKLRGAYASFVPAGFAGGLAAIYLQSAFEWVLRQQLNLVCLMFAFAAIAYLNRNWRRLAGGRGAAA